MIDSPCYGCENRGVGCHGRCERFRVWKSERDGRSRLVKRAQEKEYDIRDYSRDRAERVRLRKHAGRSKRSK